LHKTTVVFKLTHNYAQSFFLIIHSLTA